ncbi:fructose 2,6-bisphosphatase [Amylibacter ulvae]|uniref:Fructose 2,6-bisphosphatase n=1 Tax=Paramylibacter ulvae TaxID=1651968 RepID=A0ABQ3D0T7_9RHOB|nr:histidine phosphatase family protein [Amylibacter ulvae]GHA52858.1 fructose 2,6-bisphosphatase [Amylibacter ulvae]
MNEITIIRHGQANSAAKDEASYDRLSDLGHIQAGWLGEYVKSRNSFDHIVSGGMKRQIQTAQGMALSDVPHTIDPRLNELDYFGLAGSLNKIHGIALPNDSASFTEHVPHVLHHWRDDAVCDELESYADFCARIMAAMQDINAMSGRVGVVSSTGVIATLGAMALGLDAMTHARMFLRVRHTSMHKFTLDPDGVHLVQYGATPHLDFADRAHARTHI